MSSAGAQRWTQNSAGVPGTAEPRECFGDSLAIANYGRSAREDLAIGTPRESLGSRSRAGVVTVLYGRLSGLSGIDAQGWSQDSHGIKGGAEADDQFGQALSP